MTRDRKTLGTLALIAGLFLAVPAIATADDPKAADIAGKMGTVVDDLGKKKTGEPVQTEQKEIVGELDTLIASLEKECEKCRGGIKRSGKRGANDSMIGSGTGEFGPLGDPNDLGKDWGKLSDRERDRILQSMSEGFPPEYRTVLERYYRRLAEEKSAKSKTPEKEAAKPAADAKP
jgi:hypothetical protein